MQTRPVVPIEQAFHANASQDAANDAAIDIWRRAGQRPPAVLLNRREALKAERDRLILDA